MQIDLFELQIIVDDVNNTVKAFQCKANKMIDKI